MRSASTSTGTEPAVKPPHDYYDFRMLDLDLRGESLPPIRVEILPPRLFRHEPLLQYVYEPVHPAVLDVPAVYEYEPVTQEFEGHFYSFPTRPTVKIAPVQSPETVVR